MKKFLLKILCLLSFAALASSAAGCADSSIPLDDITNEYPILVTIDYNGATEANGSVNKLLYCKENSYLVEPGTVTDNTQYSVPSRVGYYIEGYYFGTKDEEGNVTLGEKCDFSNDRVTQDITLYINWVQYETIDICFDGEVINSVELRPDEEGWDVFTAGEISDPSLSGYTFRGLYFDEELTQPVTYPFYYRDKMLYSDADCTQPIATAGDGTQAPRLYADFLEGNWIFVYTAEDLLGMRPNSDVWLMNDIDMTDVEYEPLRSYSGEFRGNGHTISNIAVTRETSRTIATVGGLFDTLSSTAYIHDVTFENIRLTVDFGAEFIHAGLTDRIGLLAGVWEAGVRVEDVSIGGTVVYENVSTSQRTILCHGAYGGYGSYADEEVEAAFAAAFPTLTQNIDYPAPTGSEGE